MSDSESADVSQLGLSSAASEVNQLNFLIEQQLARISTMKLVKIVKVHLPDNGQQGQIKQSGTVDVQLITAQTDGGGNATARGIVYGMPYHRHQAGANATILDPVEGDIGMAHISDRDISASISQYQQQGQGGSGGGSQGPGQGANPGSFRRFDVSDGVYHGGVLNQVPKQYRAYTSDSINDNATKDHNKTATNHNDTATGGNITHTAKKKDNNGGNITHAADQTHAVTAQKHTVNAQQDIDQTAGGNHNITASAHNISAPTNISKILSTNGISQITNVISGSNGGSA